MTESRVYKVIIMLEGGSLAHCGAVDYEGAVWLVPKWLPSPDGQSATPERMLRLDQFPYERFDPPPPGPGPFAGADFAVRDVQLPISLVRGDLTDTLRERYVVLCPAPAGFRTVTRH